MNVDHIDDYIASVREIILQKKNSGCVALKSALAYDRGLDFTEVSKDKAQNAMKASKDTLTKEEVKAFQDYVFYSICRIAAELELPLQCHIGLGQLHKTNGMQMQEVIAKNPETKFVLFHGGYPWLEDIYGLTHFFGNVYPDLCWLPLISTSAAERMLEELIEISTSDKICWGCDTWTSQESYGALLAIREVLAKVLTKKVTDDYISIDSAKELIDHILYNNAKILYKIN